MNQLQKLQFLDKYARWDYEKGRRETWEEAVTRASDFLRELSENKLDESDYKMIHNAMLNMEAFSSMRLFALAGEAARRNNLAIYNCLGKETVFTTTDGEKSFGDFDDGEEVIVLTHLGNWKRATVRNYGSQQLYNIQIERYGQTKSVRATKNHRWILWDGIETTSLNINDKLLPMPPFGFDYEYASPLEHQCVVKSIEPDKVEDVWCLEVDDDSSFVLPEIGVCTGNCSALGIDSIDAFCEVMLLSMSGCGVGFSTEQRYISNLPSVPPKITRKGKIKHVISDDTEGWVSALRIGFNSWFSGKDIEFDYSLIRPAGSVLKTKGGRSSGGDVLRELLDYIRKIFMQNKGTRLTSIQVHDIVCKIADCVVSGGSRRSALISLFEENDDDMIHAKDNGWWKESPQRSNANNSMIIDRQLSKDEISEYMQIMHNGGSGEPGLMFRYNINRMNPQRRKESDGWLYNPCAEVNLRNMQLCNLTQSIVRPNDTFKSLAQKVRISTIIGTIQSMATYFPGMRSKWEENCERERLLGVSLDSQMDNQDLLTQETMRRLRKIAIDTNRDYAQKLGINQSAAITCVKPGGNCRPWYSLNSTSDGLLTLQELFSEHPIGEKWAERNADTYVIQDGQERRIIRTYNNGKDSLMRINMNYGLSVESTPNHKWFVKQHHSGAGQYTKINKWKMTKDIIEGDVIDIKIGAHTKTSSYKFDNFVPLSIMMRGNAKSISQPEYMNEDIAWLLGYLWGNGSLSPGGFRIRFIDQRSDNLYKAKKILKEQFGLESKIVKASENRDAKMIEVSSVILWHWLIRNGIFKYFEDEIDIIPYAVRASSKNDIIAFLSGLLDADGWAGNTEKQKGKFAFTTASPKFAHHVQHVALSIGLSIGRSKNSNRGSAAFSQKPIYLLTSNVHTDADSFDIFLRNSNKLQNVKNDKDFNGWNFELNSYKKIIVGKVKSLDFVGDNIPSYDIEVKDNHWLYAGAIKTHNSSLLFDCSSGLHARWSKYYIRRLRINAHSPIRKMLEQSGFKLYPENGQDYDTASTMVVEFPVKSPDGAIVQDNWTALQQLEWWKRNKVYWTEHNPSMTCGYTEDELPDIIDWIYDNQTIIGGLSFLPKDDHNYPLAPLEKISKRKYNKMVKELPEIDFDLLRELESEDYTTAAQELACFAGSCVI